MSKPLAKDRSVVMLTADRQIDRRILLQADSLEAKGWKVIILAMPQEDGATDIDPRIIRIGTEAVSAARRGNLLLEIYRWVPRKLRLSGSLMRAMKTLAWRYLVDQGAFLIRLFRATAFRYSPTVFVAHDLPMLPVAAIAAQRCGARVVYDSHELYCEQEFSRRERLRWAKVEAEYIKSCHSVITVNQSIAAELGRRYSIRNVEVILNAERTADLPDKSRIFHQVFGLPAETKVLLFQGGLSGGRNLETLADAIRWVRNPLVALVILGDGPIKPKLNALVVTSGLLNRIHFHPAVPQKELLRFTSAADAGVIPYQATCLNNYYCTPNKLFEFIAAGLPILGSDLPEIRKLVEGQQLGLVGDMSTPQAIGSLIDALFADEQCLASWRSNAVEARKHICWQHEQQTLVEIYEALCDERALR